VYPTTQNSVPTVSGSAQTGYSPEILEFCQREGISISEIHHVESAYTRQGVMLYTIITQAAHRQSKGRSASRRRSSGGASGGREHKSSKGSKGSSKSVVRLPPNAIDSDDDAFGDGYYQKSLRRHTRGVRDQYSACDEPIDDPQPPYSNRASSWAPQSLPHRPAGSRYHIDNRDQVHSSDKEPYATYTYRKPALGHDQEGHTSPRRLSGLGNSDWESIMQHTKADHIYPREHSPAPPPARPRPYGRSTSYSGLPESQVSYTRHGRNGRHNVVFAYNERGQPRSPLYPPQEDERYGDHSISGRYLHSRRPSRGSLGLEAGMESPSMNTSREPSRPVTPHRRGSQGSRRHETYDP
jgi:hypothetical protein